MFPRIGEWFMAHGEMTPVDVKQILKFQEHGESKLFGKIAVERQMITGRQLRVYERDLRLHGTM